MLSRICALAAISGELRSAITIVGLVVICALKTGFWERLGDDLPLRGGQRHHDASSRDHLLPRTERGSRLVCCIRGRADRPSSTPRAVGPARGRASTTVLRPRRLY